MTRLRKLQKVEDQRRSPRISALEPSCVMHHLDDGRGPAFHTRGKKKTKLRQLQQVIALSNQGVKHSPQEDIQKKIPSDQPSKLPSTFLPEKRILELVLDTLQRRDTYEIFAEPVDPNQVEDYYAIIKEPMDFGTMRAKLHEGMYKTLEQFEHDVFLIFNNAMHFNSSGTIYFRQARVINELAKKVFDVLRINPEKFEMEFSETRRQVGRRNQGDLRHSTNMKFNKITISVPSKNEPCSSHGTLSQKSFKTNHGCSDTAKHVHTRNVKVAIDSSRCGTFEVDRRCTYYKPLSHDKDESTFSTIYDKLKLLEHVSQQDIGYKDSLMLFVKDLGPTAQNMAKRKLLGCEIRTASAYAPRRPNTLNIASTSILMSQNPLNAEREKDCSSLDGDTQGSHKWSLWSNKVLPNQNSHSNSHYSRACVEYLNRCNHGSKETVKKSRMMFLGKSKLINQEQRSVSILDKCQTNVLESRLENNCKFQSRPWPLESSDVSCFNQDKSQMQKSSSECVLGDHENIEAEC